MPVLWAAVHRDESAIHLHAGLCAVRTDGQSIGTATKGIPGTKRRRASPGINGSDLQTVVYDALQAYTPALECGEPIIDCLRSGERPEWTKDHRQPRADLGQLEVRRNCATWFRAALDEIEAGRMRPEAEQRHWTGKEAAANTADIKRSRFTQTEWQALHDFQAAQDRVLEATDAAEQSIAETRAETVARQEISAGNVKPAEQVGKWLKGPDHVKERWPEVCSALTIGWQPSAWKRLREFAAGFTASARALIAELQGRIGTALGLAREQGDEEVVQALDPREPELEPDDSFWPG